MKDTIKHIFAKSDEWIRVHRNNSNTPEPTPNQGGDWWVQPLIWVVGIVVAYYILLEIMPYLLVGAVGYVCFRLFTK